MKIYPSINIELENGKRNSVVLDYITFDSDWNELKDCKVLLESWAKGWEDAPSE